METIKKKKEIYLVEGMACSGCERTVQKVIENIDGVASAKADLSLSTVSVEYDPSKVTIDRIKSAVNGVGYKFIGERPTGDQRAGNDEAVS